MNRKPSHPNASNLPAIAGWRLWCFRLALLVGAPTLLLGALELGLRLGELP